MFQVIVLSEGASGRAGFGPSFGPGNRAGRVASGRATGPDRWLRAGRANHLFNWRLGPVSQPVVQSVLQPVVQPYLKPKQSLVLQPVLQQPSSRRKVRPFNRSFNSPPTDAKSGPSTGGSTVPTAKAKFGPSTSGSFVPPTDAKFGPSTSGSFVPPTDAPDSHANAPQPKSLTMQRDSGRTASAILKIYVKLHIFIRKAKLSTT